MKLKKHGKLKLMLIIKCNSYLLSYSLLFLFYSIIFLFYFSSHNDEVINAADILSKLGFSEGVNVESETWETKAPTQHSDNNLENTDANDDDDNDNLPLDETKVLGLLGITNDQDVGEAWEKKTHKDDPII